MAKAKKLPSGNWRVLVFDGYDENKKRKYKSFTAETKKEAEFLASEYALNKKDSSAPSKMTVGEAMDGYISLRTNVLSPSTIRGYSTIRRNSFPLIRDKRIKDLTSADIQAAINDDARHHSPKTLKNAYGFLCAVLGEYRSDFAVRARLPQPKKRTPNVLTDEQISLLISELDGDTMELPILLALWLGLRRSEILGLKWGAVGKDFITIRAALVPDKDNNYVIRDQTKTVDSTRTLALPEYIARRFERLERGADDEPVFTCSKDQPLKHLKRICTRCGLPEDLRLHDLRHTMASVGLKLNIADKYMMERGGWSSNQTMKNIYQHTIKDASAAANELINNHFDSLTKK